MGRRVLLWKMAIYPGKEQIVKSSQLHLSHEGWRQQLGGIWLAQCGCVTSGIPMSKYFGKAGHSYALANQDTVS